MKVAHILNELRFSGAEVMLAAAAPYLISSGNSLVIATSDQLGDFASTLEKAGFQVFHMPFSRSSGYKAQLASLLRQEGVDLIHIHVERRALFYSVMARRLGVASVRTIHNEFYFKGQVWLRRIFTRHIAAAIGTAHVACSPSVQMNELRRYGLKTVLINNWMDPNRVPFPDGPGKEAARNALGLDNTVLAAVSLANDAPAKNLRALFLGVAEAANSGAHVRLYHCGTVGSDLQRLAQDAPSGSIILLGTVANVQPYLSACDAFLSTSFNEGGQISLLEAAAAGLTCITTKVGIAGAFDDQPAVTFIEPNAKALANALLSISKRERTALCQEGISLASWARKQFVPERGAREYGDLYARQAALVRRRS